MPRVRDGMEPLHQRFRNPLEVQRVELLQATAVVTTAEWLAVDELERLDVSRQREAVRTPNVLVETDRRPERPAQGSDQVRPTLGILEQQHHVGQLRRPIRPTLERVLARQDLQRTPVGIAVPEETAKPVERARRLEVVGPRQVEHGAVTDMAHQLEQAGIGEDVVIEQDRRATGLRHVVAQHEPALEAHQLGCVPIDAHVPVDLLEAARLDTVNGGMDEPRVLDHPQGIVADHDRVVALADRLVAGVFEK